MEKSVVAGLILDQYEEHSSDWKRYGGGIRPASQEKPESRRSLPVKQEIYDRVGRTHLISELIELEQSGLIHVKWQTYRSEPERFSWKLGDMERFYAMDGRKPKAVLFREYLAELEILRAAAPLREWVGCFLHELEEKLTAGTLPGRPALYKETPEKRNCFFLALAALNSLEEPVWRRVFSNRFLGDSKIFENEVQAWVIQTARRFHADVDADPDVMSNTQALSQLFLETYDQELLIKGSLKLTLNGQTIDLAPFLYGTVLTSDMLKFARIAPQQNIRKVITVENKANFMAMPWEEKTLLIYTHGFLSPREREFLKRLREALDETASESLTECGNAVEYFHTGDLDYGGIRIFQHIQNNIFPELKPLYMDAQTFERCRTEARPQEKAYLDKLRAMNVPACLEEVKACILECGCTVEQESLLWKNFFRK